MSNENDGVSGEESIIRTFLVAFVVCLVCAIFVATSAVSLKSVQQVNKELDRQLNILKAAGLVETNATPDKNAILTLFERIETRYVDLDSGELVAAPSESYDMAKATNDPELSDPIPTDQDIAKIHRKVKVAKIYFATDENGGVESLILPVKGYGLWSTLYGYLALTSDAREVVGLGFYQQSETPGLGGEVDNPKWKSLWPGKRVFNQGGGVALSVIKGTVDPKSPKAEYQVDGLAGATLTTRGVDNLIKFWLGDLGFGPFLANVKRRGV